MMIYALSPEHTEFGGRTTPSRHTRAPHHTETILVDSSYTMEWLANEIKSSIDARRIETGRANTKLWVLRIASHGNAGQMSIGQGLNVNTADAFSVLSNNYFEPEGPGIELWGCAVASATIIGYGRDVDLDGDGRSDAYSESQFRQFQEFNLQSTLVHRTPSLHRGASYPGILRGGRETSGAVENGLGYRMMYALARAAQIKVKGAFDVQFAELDGRDWEWEGTGLLTVLPDGTYTTLSLS